MLALLGLKGATSNNACVWCNADKSKMVGGHNQWCEGGGEPRTLATIARDLPLQKNGTKFAPVFNIPVSHFFLGTTSVVLSSFLHYLPNYEGRLVF